MDLMLSYEGGLEVDPYHSSMKNFGGIEERKVV